MYDWKEINTQISKTIMKELLLIQEFYFIHEDGIYQENDTMAMVSLLAPIFARIVMVELEPAVVTTLGKVLFQWKWCEDDFFYVIKIK